MIELRNLYKTYRMRGIRKTVADNLNQVFPSGKSVALLGRNGAGKTTLLKMISGAVAPDRGQIFNKGTLSWPVGFGGSFHGELSAVRNIRFVARIYGVDTKDLLDFVEDFAELGAHFDLPVKTYSSGMRSRLSFGLSMGIHFDTYLVDEVTAVGDISFKKKCNEVFTKRLSTSGAIVVSHSRKLVQRLCDSGAVLENGKLTYFENIRDAVAQHKKNMGGSYHGNDNAQDDVMI